MNTCIFSICLSNTAWITILIKTLPFVAIIIGCLFILKDLNDIGKLLDEQQKRLEGKE